MKLRILLLGVVLLLTSVFNVSALVDVNYQLSTNTAEVLAFNCDNADCSQISQFSGSFPNGKTTSNGELTVRFPSSLSPDGYAVYFTSQGFLPSVWHATWNSQGDSRLYTTSVPVTLEKADVCRSKVDKLKVVNDVASNTPLVIQTSASLDANTESAFSLDPAHPVKHVPSQLMDFYSAKTKVVAKVLDSSDNEVFSETAELDIFADQTVPVEFTWTPTEKGNYVVLVTTEVIDDQCTSTEKQVASSFVTVQEADAKNLCYSLLNDLEVNTINSEIGQPLEVSYSLLSNHGDISDLNTLAPVASAVRWQVIKYDGTLFEDATTEVLVDEQTTFIANSNSVNSEQHSFEFTPAQAGKYAVAVQAAPTSNLCTGEVQLGTQVVSFFIKDQSKHFVTFVLRDDKGNPVDGAEVSLSGVSIASDSSGNAKFEVVSGSYDYEITHNNFETVQGSVVVGNNDVTVAIALTPKTSENEEEIPILPPTLEEEKTSKEKNFHISINSIRIPNAFNVNPGDQVTVTFSFKNSGDLDLSEVKATALIQELGVRASSGPVELIEGGRSREYLVLSIPARAPSGTYWVRFTVSQDSVKRVVYRELTVI